MNTKKKYIQLSLFLSIIIFIQLLTYFTGCEYHLTQLTMSAYYCLLIIGLCLLMGYAGQISIGHAGFFAIGGYISAFLTTYDLSQYKDKTILILFSKIGAALFRQDLYGGKVLNFHPWAAALIAIILTIIIAILIGSPVLKLKGHYLAMATLGFGIIVYRIVLGTEKFGAADGISDIPPFPLLFGIEVNGKPVMRVWNYYISWSIVFITMTFLINLINSRVGRALYAIHGAEDASRAMGVDTREYKLKTFVLSAVLASVGGIFLTHYNGGIGPSEASVIKSVKYVAIVAIGGMANLWGSLVMGLILNFLSLRGYFGTYDDAVFGAILIIIMLFAPEGLLKVKLFDFIKYVSFRSKKSV
ncbi:MAG: branched-chain amino acid ABC transporter permease [Desulfobacterales bacterium]|nr:branched-chain amino acid ABC transporter permease [Desulfobacterales bacterium]